MKNDVTRVIILSSFVVYLTKALLTTPSFADASILLILGAFYGYMEFKADKIELNQNRIRLDEIEAKLLDLDKKVSTVKVAQGFKNLGQR